MRRNHERLQLMRKSLRRTARGLFQVRLRMDIQMRVYYSSYHLWSARHSAREARRREAELTAPTFDFRHRAHVTASVISSVAFLEAAINELYADAADNHLSYVQSLTHSERATLARFWQDGGDRQCILHKYKKALSLLSRAPLPTVPGQDAALLIRLRNDLVHFKPATRGETSAEELHLALSRRFSNNPLMKGQKNPYFPDHCLGSGCAEWAVQSALSFAAACFGLLDISPNYERLGIATASDV